MSNLRTATDYERGIPDPRNLLGEDTTKGNGKTSSRQRWCCGQNWQLTGIFWITLIVGAAVIGLVAGIFAKREELNQTTRATVSMHKDTTEMRENTEAWVKQFRSHFPPNQETVTTEQILDSIDKGHAMVQWADQVVKAIPPATVRTLVASAERLLGNATLLVEVFTAAFALPPSSPSSPAKRSTEQEQMVNGLATMVRRGAELISTVSGAEFHSAFTTVHTALQSFVRVSERVDPERVGKIVNSASDILGAADSEHIIKTMSELSRGAADVIHRLSNPGGLRVSLPLSMTPESPSPKK